jgi:uncharacterized protein YukE
MSEIGGELGAMAGFVQTFTTQQGRIDEVISAINGQMGASSGWWKGPRAERLRTAWPEYQSALRNLQELLGECGKEVQDASNGLQAVGG